MAKKKKYEKRLHYPTHTEMDEFKKWAQEYKVVEALKMPKFSKERNSYRVNAINAWLGHTDEHGITMYNKYYKKLEVKIEDGSKHLPSRIVEQLRDRMISVAKELADKKIDETASMIVDSALTETLADDLVKPGLDKLENGEDKPQCCRVVQQEKKESAKSAEEILDELRFHFLKIIELLK